MNIEQAAADYLSRKQTILWSDFDLTRNHDKASRWLAEQVRGVLAEPAAQTTLALSPAERGFQEHTPTATYRAALPA